MDKDVINIPKMCLKCMEKDVQHRCGAAEALAEDMERWLKHEPTMARGVSIRGKPFKWSCCHKAVTALSVALVVACGLGVAGCSKTREKSRGAQMHSGIGEPSIAFNPSNSTQTVTTNIRSEKKIELPNYLNPTYSDYDSVASSISKSIIERYLTNNSELLTNKPCKIVLGRFVNKTHTSLDTDIVSGKLMEMLIKSGMVVVIENNANSVAENFRNRLDISGINANTSKVNTEPDLSLAGEISSEVDLNKNSAIYLYSFRLSDIKTQRIVWRGEQTIAKQGSRGRVGF